MNYSNYTGAGCLLLVRDYRSQPVVTTYIRNLVSYHYKCGSGNEEEHVRIKKFII